MLIRAPTKMSTQSIKKTFIIQYDVIIDPSKTDDIEQLQSDIEFEVKNHLDDLPDNVGRLFDAIDVIDWKLLSETSES